jgi:hypothetical protein
MYHYVPLFITSLNSLHPLFMMYLLKSLIWLLGPLHIISLSETSLSYIFFVITFLEYKGPETLRSKEGPLSLMIRFFGKQNVPM